MLTRIPVCLLGRRRGYRDRHTAVYLGTFAPPLVRASRARPYSPVLEHQLRLALQLSYPLARHLQLATEPGPRRRGPPVGAGPAPPAVRPARPRPRRAARRAAGRGGARGCPMTGAVAARQDLPMARRKPSYS